MNGLPEVTEGGTPPPGRNYPRILDATNSALRWLKPSGMRGFAITAIVVGIVGGVTMFISIALMVGGQTSRWLIASAVVGGCGMVSLSALGNVVWQAAKLREPKR